MTAVGIFDPGREAAAPTFDRARETFKRRLILVQAAYPLPLKLKSYFSVESVLLLRKQWWQFFLERRLWGSCSWRQNS